MDVSDEVESRRDSSGIKLSVNGLGVFSDVARLFIACLFCPDKFFDFSFCDNVGPPRKIFIDLLKVAADMKTFLSYNNFVRYSTTNT